ncbi:MAG TPA: hypothetical protein VEQ59_04125 [Polyangiaceae bacterium]|nr:hypothetical protein [Polyangiaceae bacterium]
MKSTRWISLALFCAATGCAVGSAEDGVSEARDEESGDAASIVQPLTAGEGDDAVVDDSAPTVVDEGGNERIGDDFSWESLWLKSGVSAPFAAQSCATSTTMGNETAAAACCVPTSWSSTGKTAATDKVSGIYWNSRASAGAGQQIRFRALSGKQYSRLRRDCKLEYAWVYHAVQYQLRNCAADEHTGVANCGITGWTGFKNYSQRELQLCGSHANPPAGSSYWGCAFASKQWVRWL